MFFIYPLLASIWSWMQCNPEQARSVLAVSAFVLVTFGILVIISKPIHVPPIHASRRNVIIIFSFLMALVFVIAFLICPLLECDDLWLIIIGLIQIFITAIGIYFVYLQLYQQTRERIEDRYDRAKTRLSGTSEAIQKDGLDSLKRIFDRHEEYQGDIFIFLIDRMEELGDKVRKEVIEEKKLKPITEIMQWIMVVLFHGTKSMYVKLREKYKDFPIDMPKFYLHGLGFKQRPLPLHMPKVNLTSAHLEEATLFNSHLEEANLQNANLKGATLTDAHLEGARLWRANLKRAILTHAHLEGADLREANLKETHFNNVYLNGAKLSLVHLVMYDAELKKAKWDRIWVCHPKSDSLAGLIWADFEKGDWWDASPFKDWLEMLEDKP